MSRDWADDPDDVTLQRLTTIIKIFAEWLQTQGQLERHCATCCCHMYVRVESIMATEVCVCVLASLTPWPLTLGTSLFTACACCVCMCVTIVRAQQFAELSPAPFTHRSIFFFKGSFLRGQRSCYWNKDRWSFYLLVLVQHLSIITAVDVCQLMLALCVFVCVCVSGRVRVV